MSFLGPIRTLIFAAILWLPLTFFVWFAFRNVILLPIGWLCQTVFGFWEPELFISMQMDVGSTETPGALAQTFFFWNVALPVDAETQAQAAAMGKQALSTIERNPLVFGYSLPLFAGLVMATPLEHWERLKQLAIGVPILLVFWSFGVIFDVLQVLCFQAGETGLAAVQGMGLNREVVAMFYQFGYLILPSVAPIVCWIALNRVFIEGLLKNDGDRVEDAAPPPSGAAP